MQASLGGFREVLKSLEGECSWCCHLDGACEDSGSNEYRLLICSVNSMYNGVINVVNRWAHRRRRVEVVSRIW